MQQLKNLFMVRLRGLTEAQANAFAALIWWVI